MRWSSAFIPTLRDDPAQAEAVSHRLLLRAGYIRQVTAGVYSLLPLAQRVRLKIMQIIRQEMTSIGAQEFMLPALTPAELWQESGRWDTLDDIMFRLKDRRGSQIALGLTHEEVFTAIARSDLNSYRQLPQIWYQMQTKFRDEARPKAGLLRVREFTMKDSYSFDFDPAGLDVAFENHRQAYTRIFSRCGVPFTEVHASSGSMGGSQSNEFMVLCQAGEDRIVVCKKCNYSANVEKATSRPVPTEPAEDAVVEEFATPDVHTIEDLVHFKGGAPANRQVKTLVYVVDGKLGLVLIRGDHQLNETKLQDVMHARDLHAATAEEIVASLGASPGSLGAVGVLAGKTHPKICFVVADILLADARNMVTGANKDYVHVRGVSVGRDIQPTAYHDLRMVNEGEPCTECGAPLSMSNALEIGHVFKLGTRYSDAMNATVLSSTGERVPIIMGSYGIGVERLLAAIVEMHHDDKGIIWPAAVAPYFVLITPTNMSDPAVMAAAESIYKDMSDEGYEVLMDDRDERAGVKFNDADLIGVPYRVTIGKKAKDGIVELHDRATKNTLEIELTKVTETMTKK